MNAEGVPQQPPVTSSTVTSAPSENGQIVVSAGGGTMTRGRILNQNGIFGEAGEVGANVVFTPPAELISGSFEVALQVIDLLGASDINFTHVTIVAAPEVYFDPQEELGNEGGQIILTVRLPQRLFKKAGVGSKLALVLRLARIRRMGFGI